MKKISRNFILAISTLLPVFFFPLVLRGINSNGVNKVFQSNYDITPTATLEYDSSDQQNIQITPTSLPYESLAMLLGDGDGEALPTPQPGCTTGPYYDTCAFYPFNYGLPFSSYDAGSHPTDYGCEYSIYTPETYFGNNTGQFNPYCLNNGIIFPRIAFPVDKDILSTYIEFTVDGPYSDSFITDIYGEASVQPEPYDYGPPGQDPISSRAMLPTPVPWRVYSSTTAYNLGDQWELNYTRRTSDLTIILKSIMNQDGWMQGNDASFIFIGGGSSGYRRVVGNDRVPSTYTGAPARLVMRLGNIPHHSISYYWQSAIYNKKLQKTIFDTAKLTSAAQTEARRNQNSLVIIDFGYPLVNTSTIGTTLLYKGPIASTNDILEASKTYLQQYWFESQNYPNSTISFGVGTNNTGDLLCSSQNGTTHGTHWAQMINQLDAWVQQSNYSSKITVYAAIDIESFSGQGLKCGKTVIDPAPASSAINWSEAYSANTDVPYIDFGIVDNLSLGYGLNSSVQPWNGDVYWYLSWGIPEANPLPEIYMPNGSNAENWHQLARISALCINCVAEQLSLNPDWIKGRSMIFLGALTELGDMNCGTSTNTPAMGWTQLYQKLAADVKTDQYPPPFYVSDITLEGKSTADTCLP